ncbi:MAG: hypothetical protein HC915_05120 [Anaerolineae bacterium]|nr:hypothetical protein [Anaerolineae bacterium]
MTSRPGGNAFFELAYALRLALPQLTDDADGILNTGRIRTWLDAYESEAPMPLTPIEHEMLPFQLALVALFFTADACRHRSPMWVVLREASYVELAIYLIEYPDVLLR